MKANILDGGCKGKVVYSVIKKKKKKEKNPSADPQRKEGRRELIL